jgi:hydroxymethylglutaryl-CoA synthase
MGFYFPQYYVPLEELLSTRGERPGRAAEGLGVQRMAIVASNEDSITMAANAVESLQCEKKKIGKLIFATECGLDSAKDNACYIHDLCGLPENCEAYDVKAACAASTFALWQVIDWILSGRGKGKFGLVVCSDNAIYKYKTGAELTGGGGAVAILVSEAPSILDFNLEIGNYKSNMRDFWKPLDSKYAIVAENGKSSIKSYLDALTYAVRDYLNHGGNRDFDYLVFHTPYAKMVYKAFETLSNLLPEIKGKFESMTADSLKAPAQIGNIYNGALYLALASLLELKGTSAQRKNIGLYSFGSGSSSIFFRGIVSREFNNNLNLFKQLNAMKKLAPEKYEQIRCGELTLEEKKGFLLKRIDDQGYRHYIKA